MRAILGAAFALTLLLSTAGAKELPKSDSQTCDLLSTAEAKTALGGGIPEIIDADAPPGTLYCAWAVDNGTILLNKLSITLIDGSLLGGYNPPGYYQAARMWETGAGAITDLAGTGQAAFALTDSEGATQIVVLNGDWIALVRGAGMKPSTVAEAARLMGARLGSVQHPLSREPLAASCALLSLADAAAALRHFPFVTAGDTPEGRGSCTWSYGGAAFLSLVTREGAGLAGQSPSEYFKNALLNEQVSRAVDMVEVGDRAFISPANPDGRYFYLMMLQNQRIGLMSGLGIDKRDAVGAAAAAATRM